jgi:hypothetical protein
MLRTMACDGEEMGPAEFTHATRIKRGATLKSLRGEGSGVGEEGAELLY